jgi:hypothetical protein
MHLQNSPPLFFAKSSEIASAERKAAALRTVQRLAGKRIFLFTLDLDHARMAPNAGERAARFGILRSRVKHPGRARLTIPIEQDYTSPAGLSSISIGIGMFAA